MNEPSFKNTTDDFKGTSLDDATADGLTAPYTDIDDTLKSEAKAISSVLVVIGGVHCRDELWRADIWRGKTVDVARTLWRRRT